MTPLLISIASLTISVFCLSICLSRIQRRLDALEQKVKS